MNQKHEIEKWIISKIKYSKAAPIPNCGKIRNKTGYTSGGGLM
jgi:hypothetical protein